MIRFTASFGNGDVNVIEKIIVVGLLRDATNPRQFNFNRFP